MKREIATGINAVDSLLEISPERVTQLWLHGDSARLRSLEDRARYAGISVQRADNPALDRLSDGARHQGVVAEIIPAGVLDLNGVLALIKAAGDNALVLVLDGVQDPHNLGACLRSAAAANATAVIVPKARAAGLTPAVRRAAAGAADIVPLAMVSNLASALRALAEIGVWSVGLAGDGDSSLYESDLTGPLALVLGGEEKGLRRLTRERCDALARIPMPGRMESLNVSVAAGIALFEALRQRTQSPPSLAKGGAKFLLT